MKIFPPLLSLLPIPLYFLSYLSLPSLGNMYKQYTNLLNFRNINAAWSAQAEIKYKSKYYMVSLLSIRIVKSNVSSVGRRLWIWIDFKSDLD